MTETAISPSRISGSQPHLGAAAAAVHLPDEPSVRFDWIDTPAGRMIAAANRDGICLLEFANQQRVDAQRIALEQALGLPLLPGSNHWLTQLFSQLDQYFAGRRRAFDLPLVIRGTAFQERVWQALMTIPYGVTWSYRDLAERIGQPRATRAVGTANGMNRLGILIPCHRVVNADGRLGGYAGGVERKRHLLELERLHAS